MATDVERRLESIEAMLLKIVEQLGIQLKEDRDLEFEAEIEHANTLETWQERLAYIKKCQKRRAGK